MYNMGKSFLNKVSLWVTNLSQYESEKLHFCSDQKCNEYISMRSLHCNEHCPKCKYSECNQNAYKPGAFYYDYCRDHICNNGNHQFDVCKFSKKLPFECCKNCLCPEDGCAETKLTAQLHLANGRCYQHSNVCEKKDTMSDLNCSNRIAPDKTYCAKHECRIEECDEPSSSRRLCTKCINKHK
jgi:hypothetical protein